MTDTSKSVTVITGATSGIGLALARLFAANGQALFLVARYGKRLAQLQQEWEATYGIAVRYAAGDLTKADFRESLPTLVRAAGYSVRCLVNNAGSGTYGSFAETKWAAEESSIILNALVPTHLSKLFLSDLRAHQGSILNIVSIAGFLPGPRMAVYYASKAYLLSLSESLRAELEAVGVRVTAVLPGPTATGFQTANSLSELPVGRYPSADDVAYFAFRSWQRNRAIAIYGFRNRIVYLGAKLLPRYITRRLMSWYMR